MNSLLPSDSDVELNTQSCRPQSHRRGVWVLCQCVLLTDTLLRFTKKQLRMSFQLSYDSWCITCGCVMNLKWQTKPTLDDWWTMVGSESSVIKSVPVTDICGHVCVLCVLTFKLCLASVMFDSARVTQSHDPAAVGAILGHLYSRNLIPYLYSKMK